MTRWSIFYNKICLENSQFSFIVSHRSNFKKKWLSNLISADLPSVIVFKVTQTWTNKENVKVHLRISGQCIYGQRF